MNTAAYPEIPKVGLHNGDAFCQTRKLFLSDMYRWGIETFFTISMSMAAYTPEITDQLFVWPNFVDANVFKDYGQPKTAPLLFMGSFASHYPWRRRTYEELSEHFAYMRCPHLGWADRRSTAGMIFGESYARLLNSALASPACGTMANDIVRKHFEIPGSKTCLIAQPSAALEAAGFRDMENCLLCEPDDLVDNFGYP